MKSSEKSFTNKMDQGYYQGLKKKIQDLNHSFKFNDNMKIIYKWNIQEIWRNLKWQNL